MEAREMERAPHLPGRSNTDLNLSVLRRYLPDIRSILSIAANAVVYLFSETTQNWDKTGMEGTMFVCEQDPIVTATGQTLPQICVFVLNRRGLDNLVVDLMRVSDCEMAQELIIFRLEEDEGSESNGSEDGPAEKKVLGIWIHADEDDTREVNMTIIRGAWQQARSALDNLIASAEEEEADNGAAVSDGQTEIPGQSGQSGGRRLSITELFGQRISGR
jgi:Dcp1-like decapping family